MCEWNSFFPNWSLRTKSRTVLLRVPIREWNILFRFSEFLYCSFIGNLELFCSEFLTVKRTYCSLIGHLRTNWGLFCCELPSANGTYCSKIYNLQPFCAEFLFLNGTVFSPKTFRTVLFRVPIREWNILFRFSEFLSVNETICSCIGRTPA